MKENFKILTIVGARPQFIKASVVSKAILEYNQNNSYKIEEKIIHTGQHYDTNMSDIFFDEMKIPKPSYNLSIGSGSHAEQTGKMMIAIENVFVEEKPEMVLVYGDTNSTLAGALTASKLHIPIAHVEAGLRSFNREMPEEINRVLTDQLSSILFCPTNVAIENLKKEGIPNKNLNNKVIKSGDVMYDASIYFSNIATNKWLMNNNLKPNNYVLATVHRAENTNNIDRLYSIIEALANISNDICQVVFPIHPRTRLIINEHKELQSIINKSNIKAIAPIGFLDMICAEKNSKLIITDSGGIQKEAYFHKKPCVTLREETEWIELVISGWNKLAGVEKNNIVSSVSQMIDINVASLIDYDFYGKGDAGKIIISALVDYFSQGRE